MVELLLGRLAHELWSWSDLVCNGGLCPRNDGMVEESRLARRVGWPGVTTAFLQYSGSDPQVVCRVPFIRVSDWGPDSYGCIPVNIWILYRFWARDQWFF